MQQPPIPKISVVIAVYNNKEYLSDAIASALAQDYPNLDVWVCDDCSTEQLCIGHKPPDPIWADLSLPERMDEIEFCRSYDINTYGQKRIIYYIRLKKNSGPSTARNIAIANAIRSGSHLFQILDSDDQMYPNKVSELIQPFLQNPECVALSYGDYIIRGEDGVCRYEAKPAFDFQRLMNGDCHIHSGSLVSGLAIKDFYPDYYPPDQRVAEDLALWFKIFRQGRWMAYHVGKPLTLVRSHRNDSTNSVSKETWNLDYQKAFRFI